MNELVAVNGNLPDKIEDIAKFVLVGREKVAAVRAEILAIEKLQLAQEVRDKKRIEVRLLSEVLFDAEVRLGELFRDIPKGSGGDRGNQYTGGKIRTAAGFGKSENKPKKDVIAELGFSQDQSERLEKLADNKDIVEFVKAEARESGEIPTRARVLELVAARKNNADDAHNSSDSDDDSGGAKIIDLADYGAWQVTAVNEHEDFLDLRVEVYKELSKINEALNRFKVDPHRMEALRDNFDEILTVENELLHINNSIDKLNLIKLEILKGKGKQYGKK